MMLGAKIKIEFMGTVNWFLGTNFDWSSHQDGSLSVHLSQEAYVQNIVKTHHIASINFNPIGTLYRSRCPIDATLRATTDKEDQAFVRRREACQTLFCRLAWLTTNTRPDLSTAVSVLVPYSSFLTQQHLEAALYVVRYLHSKTSQGIAYHSSASSATSAYLHHPPSHDREAYTDATPPPPIVEIQGFCDVKWGSQIGGAVADGKEIFFKYRSKSGYLSMWCGGPIAWSSTCKANIHATDEAVKDILSLCHRCNAMHLTR